MIDKDTVLYYFLKDHLGTTRLTIREDSVVTGRYYRYYAFGGTESENVSLNQEYKYTGKPMDDEFDLDIYYYGARYYQPSLGRWIAVDPLHSKYPGWSPYVYTLDNPMKFVDPDGSEPKNQEYVQFQESQPPEMTRAADYEKAKAWTNDNIVQPAGDAAYECLDFTNQVADQSAKVTIGLAAYASRLKIGGRSAAVPLLTLSGYFGAIDITTDALKEAVKPSGEGVIKVGLKSLIELGSYALMAVTKAKVPKDAVVLNAWIGVVAELFQTGIDQVEAENDEETDTENDQTKKQ